MKLKIAWILSLKSVLLVAQATSSLVKTECIDKTVAINQQLSSSKSRFNGGRLKSKSVKFIYDFTFI